MQIVIEIPEEDYQKINSKEKIITLSCNIVDVIRDGTPLPKGHGKIGDIDRLQEVFRRNVACADAYKQLFVDAPTIIEADKGEE